MKTIDSVEFQNIKSIIEGNKQTSDKFEMKFLAKGALDKALMVTRKN